MTNKTELFRLKGRGSTCYYVINDIKKELVVTAIRGEFIYCKEPNDFSKRIYKFHMSDGYEECVYSCSGILYPSKQFYENKEAASILRNKLIKILPNRLDTLRKIEALIINADIINSTPNVKQPAQSISHLLNPINPKDNIIEEL